MDSWSRLKDIMKSKFQRLMTIQMKAELRKSLRQDDKESASDFYHRCKEAEKVAEYLQVSVLILNLSTYLRNILSRYDLKFFVVHCLQYLAT